MYKWIWSGAALTVLIAAIFFTFAPAIVENSMNKVDTAPQALEYKEAKASGAIEESVNKVDRKSLPKISIEAAALHKTLIIADLHSDTLMWDRDINARANRGHMDVPRLIDGNVALQVFSSVTKTPKDQNYDSNSNQTDNITMLVMAQLQPVKTWSSLLERSLYHAAKLDQAVKSPENGLTKLTRSKGIDNLLLNRDKREIQTGALLSIEGLHNLEGKRENLNRLYAAGYRMAGLTHFFDNELAGSMHGIKKGGLTPFGRQIIIDMQAMGMIVDIAHLSHTGVAEVLSLATRPVISSHGGVQATCKVNRNLTDDEIRGIAKTGGVIGIGYWEGAVCDTSPAGIASAIKHIRDLVGIQYVALGSDYDGATTVRFDTSQLVHVTQALMDIGFSETEIRSAMGENAIQVLRAGIIPMRLKVQ